MSLPDFSCPAYLYDYVAKAIREGGRFDVEDLPDESLYKFPIAGRCVPSTFSLVTITTMHHGRPTSMRRYRLSFLPGIPTVLVASSLQKG